ncbi:MAG TPA: hypothetical protein VK785_08340 [Opitutaceae bacterium]|jgi:hypothetical protein|nr:hypothetical protein [Opitutaceae bacterium]
MSLTKKLTLVLVTAAAACIGRADVSATADSVGTIGQRYGELSFTDQSIKHVSSNAYDGELGFNLPVFKHLDLGASYTYGWFKFNNQILHSNIVQADATAYTTLAGVKPFASAALGYEFDRTTSGTTLIRAHFGVWSATVGVEIPVQAAAITPFVSYQDDFRNSANSSQAFEFGVEANYWFTAKWAVFDTNWGVFADAGYQDQMHSSFDAWDWTVGLRRKF